MGVFSGRWINSQLGNVVATHGSRRGVIPLDAQFALVIAVTQRHPVPHRTLAPDKKIERPTSRQVAGHLRPGCSEETRIPDCISAGSCHQRESRHFR